MPLVCFYTPLKNQKTRDFWMFLGDKERDQWHEMDQGIPEKLVF